MRKILFVIFSIFILSFKAQVNAPSFRCISCNAAGDLKLTWVIPPDPSNQFLRYDIYKGITPGSLSYLGSVATYSINNFTDLSVGNTQSFYFYVKTISTVGASTVASRSSDTLRSIYLNVSGVNVASLLYNNLHIPQLPTSGSSFNVYREHPVGVWANVNNTTATSYSETISICSVKYNYQIQLSDNSGCVSSSNINGGSFFDQTPPTSPVLDSVSVDLGGQSHLGWNPSPSPDCIGYIIYQQNGGGAWINIDTVFGINNTVYTNTNVIGSSTSVNYCVAPLDSCKNLGLQTQDQNTIFLSGKYDICSRTAKLHWKAYKNLQGGILKYNVYCSVNSAAYTLIGTTTTDTNFVHQNLVPGKNYCYMVRVFNNALNITSSSNPRCFVASAPPASSFAYVQTATVDFLQNIYVTIFADTTKACNGFNIYKSEDGINFKNVAYMKYSGTSHYYYVDTEVSAKQKNYFYKATVLDSCGNERYTSNVGKTILLKVKNDTQKYFSNNLSWDNYTTWLGGVSGYYIYRVINEVPETTPITFVPFGVTTYTDNVEDIVTESGKVGYYVQAVENFGNPYGLAGISNSNIGDAYVEANIYVPNAFTPEGENRIWLPKAQFVEKSDYHVMVFDRWGAKMFETNDDTKGWNGDGKEQGTYVYIIQYKNSRGEYIEIKGPVTMIR